MKVIFMGTPEFACPALEKLIKCKQVEICGVFTKEPKIANRGQKISKSAIHKLAEINNLRVFTPKNFKDEKNLEEFKSLKADIALVVAYGIILPKTILESTKFGCINIHPSILPKYRGATPIQSALLSQDKKTGVSIIKMDEGIDSGDIISQKILDIDPNFLYTDLAEMLANIGAEMALDAIINFKENKISLTMQDSERSSLCYKIKKEDSKIDFSKDVSEIIAKIKALSGYLTCFTEVKNERIKIFSAKEVIFNNSKLLDFKNGEIVDQSFIIKCKNGFIQPQILQREGKKIVNLKEFLLGYKVI